MGTSIYIFQKEGLSGRLWGSALQAGRSSRSGCRCFSRRKRATSKWTSSCSTGILRGSSFQIHVTFHHLYREEERQVNQDCKYQLQWWAELLSLWEFWSWTCRWSPLDPIRGPSRLSHRYANSNLNTFPLQHRPIQHLNPFKHLLSLLSPKRSPQTPNS